MKLPAWSPTFFFHAGPETLVQSAEATLVPLVLVHNALPAEPEGNTSPMKQAAALNEALRLVELPHLPHAHHQQTAFTFCASSIRSRLRLWQLTLAWCLYLHV